ncbi:MAG: tetratricopeptide repeat protein [Bacteroides graminisolvens]|jgi:hypothetical protein|nr:tetratricopeptide repeat protein [Bacteroides graminisolvens]
MMRLFLCYFFLTVFPFFTIAQSSDKKKIEQVILESEHLSDTSQLWAFFDQQIKILPNFQKDLLKRVHKVRIAQLNAQNTGQTDPLSTVLMKEANEDYPQEGDKGVQAWLQTQAGFYFYSFSHYDQALPYFVKARRIMDNFPKDKSNLSLIGETYMKNAFFASTINDDVQVIPYLQTALDYTPKTSKNYGTILTAMGMHYFRQGLFDDAMEYHQKSISSALSINDSVRYAKALGEIAQIHKVRKEYDEAEKLLEEDIAISKRHRDERNTMFAQILLGKLYLLQNNITSAKKTLNEANAFAESKSYLKSYEFQIAEVLLQIAQLENDSMRELDLWRKLKDLEAILMNTDGDVAVRRVNMQAQRERFDYQLQLEKSKLQQETLKKITFGIVAVLSVLGLILSYIAQKRKLKFRESEYQKKVISLQLDKSNSEKKLMETHNSLIAYQTYLLEKNEQISSLENEIKMIASSSSFNLEKNHRSLKSLLESHLMTDDNWFTFKNAFIREDYPTYKNLLEQFPGITESALRIELIQALGLNNAETARILGITVDAVKKSKQRLRKKSEVY